MRQFVLILLIALLSCYSTVYAQFNVTVVYGSSNCTGTPSYAAVTSSCAYTNCTLLAPEVSASCVTLSALPPRTLTTAPTFLSGQYIGFFSYSDTNCTTLVSNDQGPLFYARPGACVPYGVFYVQLTIPNNTTVSATFYNGPGCTGTGLPAMINVGQCNSFQSINAYPVIVSSSTPGVSPRVSGVTPSTTTKPPTPPGGNASAIFLSAIALIFALFAL